MQPRMDTGTHCWQDWLLACEDPHSFCRSAFQQDDPSVHRCMGPFAPRCNISSTIVFHKVLSVLLVTFLSLRRSQMVSREVYSTVFQSPTEADCCVAPWTFSLKTEVTFIFFPSHWEMCHLSKIIQSGPAETSAGSLNTHQVDSIKKRGLVYLLDSANKVTQDSLPSANAVQRMQLKCCFLHF